MEKSNIGLIKNKQIPRAHEITWACTNRVFVQELHKFEGLAGLGFVFSISLSTHPRIITAKAKVKQQRRTSYQLTHVPRYLEVWLASVKESPTR